MKVTQAQIERWNTTDRQNREAKREERKWLQGLKRKAEHKKTEEWELQEVVGTGLLYRSKTYCGPIGKGGEDVGF